MAVPMWVLDCDYVPNGKQSIVDSFHEPFELNGGKRMNLRRFR